MMEALLASILGQRNLLHLVAEDPPVRAVLQSLPERVRCLEWKLAGCRDQREAVAAANRNLPLWMKAANIDALLSLLSDLQDDGGASEPVPLVLFIHGIDDLLSADREGFDNIVGILPNLMDRWSDGSEPAQIVMDGEGEVLDRIRETVEQRNRILAARDLEVIRY